jgi:hypothetical protein
MIARLCGIAPGAPIGGCDPPQPAKTASVAHGMSGNRKAFMADP